MKVALYIEDGYEQIALTPESEAERMVTDKLLSGRVVSFKRGGFYHCSGGWVRHHQRETPPDSVMIVMEQSTEPAE